MISLRLAGMTGLRPEVGAALQHGVIVLLLYLTASQVLHLAATVAPNQDAAFMVAIAWTAINIMEGNFIQRHSDMGMGWAAHLRWLSAMYYAFEGSSTAQYKNGTFSCGSGFGSNTIEYLPRMLPNTGALQLPFVQNIMRNPGPDCAVDTDKVLEYFNVTLPSWQVAVILLGYLLLMHLLTFLAFVVVARKERR